MRLLSSAVLLAVLPLTFTPAGDKKGKKETPQQTMFRLTNEFRKAEGKEILKFNEELTQAAQKHAENLARQDKAGDSGNNPHILDGKNPQDRAKEAGYKGAVGENVGLAIGGPQPEKTFEGLKKSPPHRQNALGAQFKEMGVGAAKSKSGKWWYCQVFGQPAE